MRLPSAVGVAWSELRSGVTSGSTRRFDDDGSAAAEFHITLGPAQGTAPVIAPYGIDSLALVYVNPDPTDWRLFPPRPRNGM